MPFFRRPYLALSAESRSEARGPKTRPEMPSARSLGQLGTIGRFGKVAPGCPAPPFRRPARRTVAPWPGVRPCGPVRRASRRGTRIVPQLSPRRPFGTLPVLSAEARRPPDRAGTPRLPERDEIFFASHLRLSCFPFLRAETGRGWGPFSPHLPLSLSPLPTSHFPLPGAGACRSEARRPPPDGAAAATPPRRAGLGFRPGGERASRWRAPVPRAPPQPSSRGREERGGERRREEEERRRRGGGGEDSRRKDFVPKFSPHRPAPFRRPARENVAPRRGVRPTGPACRASRSGTRLFPRPLYFFSRTKTSQPPRPLFPSSAGGSPSLRGPPPDSLPAGRASAVFGRTAREAPGGAPSPVAAGGGVRAAGCRRPPSRGLGLRKGKGERVWRK